MALAQHPNLVALTDEQVIEALWRARAMREAMRPNGDAIKRLVLTTITPLEFALAVRGVSVQLVAWPTPEAINAARLGYIQTTEIDPDAEARWDAQMAGGA